MANKVYTRDDIQLVSNDFLYESIGDTGKPYGLFYAIDENDGDSFVTGIVNLEEFSTDFENFSNVDACMDYLVDVANHFMNGEF